MRRREFIHRLIGRPGRLDVAVWIVRTAGDVYFTQRDAVIGVGDVQGEVRSNLEALVEMELLEKTSEGRPHYRRIQSPIWPALVQLADAVSALATGQAEPRLEADPPRGLLATSAEAPPVTIPRRPTSKDGPNSDQGRAQRKVGRKN